MTRKQRRMTIIGGSLAVLALAAALVLNALRDSIVFFSTPTMVAEKHIAPGKRFRLGGLVQPGSLQRGDNLAVTFEVADGSAKLPVAYKGILPDLFREGQGSSPKVRWTRAACSRPTRCLPSMTKPTCPRTWPTP